MAKQAITLKIAGKSYPFQIESGKEEMYRLAEREVNQYLALINNRISATGPTRITCRWPH